MSCLVSANYGFKPVECRKQIVPANKNNRSKRKTKNEVEFPRNIDLTVKKILFSLTSKKFIKCKPKPLRIFQLEISTNKGRKLFGIYHSLDNPLKPTEMIFSHLWETSEESDVNAHLSRRIKLNAIQRIEDSKLHSLFCRWLNKRKPSNKPWLVTLQVSGETTTGLLIREQKQALNTMPSVSLHSDPENLSIIYTTSIDRIASLKRVDSKIACNAYRNEDAFCSYLSPPRFIKLCKGFNETATSWGKFFYESVND